MPSGLWTTNINGQDLISLAEYQRLERQIKKLEETIRKSNTPETFFLRRKIGEAFVDFFNLLTLTQEKEIDNHKEICDQINNCVNKYKVETMYKEFDSRKSVRLP